MKQTGNRTLERSVSRKASLQFSLRTLLAAVAALGVGAGLWVGEPSWQVGAIDFLFVGWIVASTRMLSIHANGIAKAWWLEVATQCTLASFLFFTLFGFLVNQAIHYKLIDEYMPLYTMEWIARNLSSKFRYLLAAWAFAPVVGLLCVFMHCFLGSPGGNCDG